MGYPKPRPLSKLSQLAPQVPRNAYSRTATGFGKLRAFGLALTPFNEGENAGQMEKPHALYFSGFADGDGANEAFACPFVKFWPGAAGIKLMSALGCPHPDRQITLPVGHDLLDRRRK